MSQQNVEIVRAVYEPLNRGDWEGVFRDTHPEFEITTQRGLAAGTYRGHEAVKRQIQDLLGAFETWTVEPEEFFDVGDYVVAFVKTRARPTGSRVDMEVRNGHLWTVQDGTIRSVKTFPVRDEALAAAGLPRE
jgi:ketosteroid isomerase-like protein